MNVFFKVLDFFRLYDKGRLSITNIAVIVLLYKIATADTLDWPVAASLLVTLFNYGHKRVVDNKSLSQTIDQISPIVNKIETIVKKVES